MPQTQDKKTEIKKNTGIENTSPKNNTVGRPGKRNRLDYIEMAKERNARVILHNTPDTYPLTEMARYADQGIRRLRNRIMISLAPGDALPLLDEYNDALLALHTIIAKICEITNVRYQTPRALRNLISEEGALEKSVQGIAPPAATS